MKPGGICVQTLMKRQGFALTDSQSEALWDEVKAFWRKHDQENPVDPAIVGPDENPEDFTMESTIREIEESSDGGLDTMPRGDLKSGIAQVCGNTDWPCNGDSDESTHDAYMAIGKGLLQRGAQIDPDVD